MTNRPPQSGCSIAANSNSGSPLRSPPSSPSPPQPFAIVQLAAAIRSNSDRIAAAERRTTGQSELATQHQCDLALRFIAHYAAHTAGHHMQTLAYVVGGSAAEAAAIAAHEPFQVDGTSRRSLFEVLTGLAMHFRVGHAVTVRLDAARSYLKVSRHIAWTVESNYLRLSNSPKQESSILGDCCSVENDENNDDDDVPRSAASFGATQIVFDSGDAAAAFAELNNAHADRTAPWRIRVCWVQESLRHQFEDTFRATSSTDEPYTALLAHVRPLGGSVRYTSAGEALVVDVPLSLWQLPVTADVPSVVVLVQFFRTCKDAIALLRKQSPVSTQSLSVWTENISITLELAKALPGAQNVWQNCVGLLDPHVPFTFPLAGGSCIYGSELALCQTFIARRSSADQRVDAKRLAAAFAGELAVENADYSAMRVLDRMAYMTSSRRRAHADGAVAEWVTRVQNVQKRPLITNVVFNQFQTIVVPYGTIFAN